MTDEFGAILGVFAADLLYVVTTLMLNETFGLLAPFETSGPVFDFGLLVGAWLTAGGILGTVTLGSLYSLING